MIMMIILFLLNQICFATLNWIEEDNTIKYIDRDNPENYRTDWNFETGNYLFAKNMHLKLYPIFKKIFMVSNPVPIKAALKKAGLIESYVRLPLVELNDSQKAELYNTIDKFIEE